MCVFVWHPEPCILTFLKYNNVSSIDLLYAFCAHGQNFVCTKVASKFLITPNLFSNQLGYLVILLLKIMTAAVNITGIGLQIYLGLWIMRTLKSSFALVFAETNLLVVLDFPQHKGYLRFEKPMGVEILLVTFPGIFKPSILNADVIHFTLVATTSCTFSERVKFSTCKLDSNFESKAQPLKRLFLDFLFKNFLLPTRLLPFSPTFAVFEFSNQSSIVFFNFSAFSPTKPKLFSQPKVKPASTQSIMLDVCVCVASRAFLHSHFLEM